MENLAITILTNKYLIIGVTILAALVAIFIAGWLAKVLIEAGNNYRPRFSGRACIVLT